MTALANRLAGLNGGRSALVAILAGALCVIAFAPLYIWPVLFLTFGVLVFLLDGCHAQAALRPRLICAGLTGFWFGFGYFLAGLYWTAEAFLVEPLRHAWLLPFVMTLLPAGMALFFAAAAALAMTMWAPGSGRALALAIALGLAEFARGHVLTGLPWNLIGYGILGTLPLMQIASLFGVYALSLLAVLLFASPAAILAPTGSKLAAPRSAVAFACVLILLLGAGFVWGKQRLASGERTGTDIRLRIVQANIDQADKWRPENSVQIFNDYLALTTSAGLEKIDVVIWPETAVPFLLADSPDALAAIGNALPDKTALLVGAARIVDDRDAEGRLTTSRIYNSVLAIDSGGRVTGGYDKIHLVPFGEYLPFQDFLEGLGIMQLTGIRGGFSAGTGPRRLEISGIPPLNPLICYEIIFPDGITRSGVRPEWLLNVTNDAWFGTSAGPYQHFHQAQIRAVEQGLPVVRAANTGISSVIDSYGRILGEVGLGKTGILDATLPRALSATLFARFERGVELSVLALAFLAWAVCRVQLLR